MKSRQNGRTRTVKHLVAMRPESFPTREEVRAETDHEFTRACRSLGGHHADERHFWDNFDTPTPFDFAMEI